MADIKQMPLRMPTHVWEAAKRKAGPNSLNAWIVDLIQREVQATPPGASLMDVLHEDEPVAVVGIGHDPVVAAEDESTRSDGPGSVETRGPVAPAATGHLHKGVPFGDPYRNAPGGMLLRDRVCSICGETLPPTRA